MEERLRNPPLIAIYKTVISRQRILNLMINIKEKVSIKGKLSKDKKVKKRLNLILRQLTGMNQSHPKLKTR